MSLIRAVLHGMSSFLSEVSQNSNAWTYTINSFDGSPYITRTLLPRIFGHRVILHRIWQADRDRHLHNHPWETASFLIAAGGYTEERLSGDGKFIEVRKFSQGGVNQLTCDTFHRIRTVEPNTWTIGVIGRRVQSWGFLVDGEIVDHLVYFASKQHTIEAGGFS